MSVLLPPAQDQKVMLIGGGNDNGTRLHRTAPRSSTSPSPTRSTPRRRRSTSQKMYVSAVILPDRTVFETGGAQKQREYGNSYVYSSQIYDPQTGAWTKAKDSTVPRGYHSSALLLPDGRVATFGNNPSDGSLRAAHRDLLAGVPDEGDPARDHRASRTRWTTAAPTR